MKSLIILSVLFGAALAQQQQNRRQNYQQQQQQQNNNQQYDQDQEQYQEQPPAKQAPQQNFQAPAQQLNSNNYQPKSHHESTTFIPIIRFDKEQGNDGSYKAAWETGNMIFAQEEGYLKNLGPNPDEPTEDLNAQVQQGSYSYTSPEGQVISVSYTADETGFHPTGDHLPTPPPVSPEVQKGLDLIYEGIRKQQELADREAQNPSANQHNTNQIKQNYNGQYNSNQNQNQN